MRTPTPHRAHVNTRASAAATVRAFRGLYNSRRARDALSGYPVHRATAAGDQEARDASPGLHPQNPCSACHTFARPGNRLRSTPGGSLLMSTRLAFLASV
jgi:hypothetical protein